MKKLYMLGLVIVCASLTGCTLNAPTIPTISTGDTQLTTREEATETLLTGMVDTWVLGEEITEPIDAVEVPMVEGSEDIVIQESGVVIEAKKLIEERNTQPKDESKVNEPDIDLMQKIIDLFK